MSLSNANQTHQMSMCWCSFVRRNTTMKRFLADIKTFFPFHRWSKGYSQSACLNFWKYGQTPCTNYSKGLSSDFSKPVVGIFCQEILWGAIKFHLLFLDCQFYFPCSLRELICFHHLVLLKPLTCLTRALQASWFSVSLKASWPFKNSIIPDMGNTKPDELSQPVEWEKI